MKVLTVVTDLGKGGTQRAAQNFCEGYDVLGHDSRIMAVDSDGLRREELLKAGICVWVGTTERVIEEISVWGPTIIHLHSIGLKLPLVSVLRNKCEGARFIETNIFSDLSAYTKYLDYSFQLSEWCAYNYLSRGGVKSRCSIVPNPIKTERFYRVSGPEVKAFRSKYAIPDDVFVFGRVGQHFFDKWSFSLIDVFEKFVSTVTDRCLLLVVNPPPRIVEYAHVRGLTNRLVIIDEIIGDEELRRCYSSIDIFLHIANQGESFGFVLAESMLCETPVITLNTPWSDNSQAEVVGNRVGGYCVNTLKAFVQCMKMLYHDPLLRSTMGKNGRKTIITRYDYRAVAAKSIGLCREASAIGSLYSLPIFKKLKSEGIQYSLMVRFLLMVKLRFLEGGRMARYHTGVLIC